MPPLKKGWYRRSVVKKCISLKYDLIIIDGPPRELRKGILNNLSCFRSIYCPVIFDDVNRPEDKEIMLTFCKKMGYDFKIITGPRKAFAHCSKT